MLQELGYVCHNGFLIGLVYINIWEKEVNQKWYQAEACWHYHGRKKNCTNKNNAVCLFGNRQQDLEIKQPLALQTSVKKQVLFVRFHRAESHSLIDLNYTDVKLDLSEFILKGRREEAQMVQIWHSERYPWLYFCILYTSSVQWNTADLNELWVSDFSLAEWVTQRSHCCLSNHIKQRENGCWINLIPQCC